MSAALAPVRIDGWTLFQAGSAHWIRDLDLADQAELEKPRDIRTTIRKAIQDGAVTIAGNPGDGSGPVVRVEKVLVPIGSGAMREVEEFYLSEEAALIIVTRLRTQAAVQLTRAICRVFLLVARGELPARPAQELSTRRAELFIRIVELLPPGTCETQRIANLAHASAALTGERPALPEARERWRRPTAIANDIGATVHAVGRAISALGLKERFGMSRAIEDIKTHGAGVCTVWDYNDAAVELIREHIAAAPPKPAKPKKNKTVTLPALFLAESANDAPVRDGERHSA